MKISVHFCNSHEHSWLKASLQHLGRGADVVLFEEQRRSEAEQEAHEEGDDEQGREPAEDVNYFLSLI